MLLFAKLYKKIHLLLILTFSCVLTFGQFVLKGKLVSQNKKPVQSATVSLYNISDSNLVKVSLSDSLGKFSFSFTENKKHFLKISHLNVGDTTIIIGSDTSVLVILKETNDNYLQNVVVKNTSKLIDVKVDRIVFNPDLLASSIGANAFEVLGKAPLISAKENGNISINGVGSAGIMINGRLLQLSESQIIDYLKSIPADQIQKIEIITNPSSKYDAEGLSGLINIVLVKSKKKGLNGQVSMYGLQNSYFKNGFNGNLNFRTGKLNIYGSTAYSAGKYYTQDLVDNIYNKSTAPYYYYETGDKYRNKKSLFSTLGIDYTINKNSTIGIVATNTLSQILGNEHNTATFQKTALSDSFYKTIILYTNKSQNTSVNLNYSNNLDSLGQTLSIDLDYYKYHQPELSTNNSTERFNGISQKLGQDIDFFNKLNQDIELFSFKSDYTKPFAKVWSFDAGVKFTHIQTGNNISFSNYTNGVYVLDADKSNNFNYKETNAAAYINVSTKIGNKWTLQTGVRGEQTNLDGMAAFNGLIVKQDYFKLFPSLFINYNPNDNNQFAISYTKRVHRPAFEDLNPFRYYSSPVSYIEGNPFLQPAFTGSFNVSYTYKQNYYFSLFLYNTNNEIAQMPIFDATNTSFKYISANLNKTYNVGFSSYLPVKIKEWLTSNFSVLVGYNGSKYYSDSFSVNNNRFNFQFQVSNSLTFSEKNKFYGEVAFTYQPSGIAQGVSILGTYADLSFGIKKTFKDNRTGIAINVIDLLNMAYVPTKVDQANQYSLIHGNFDMRGIRVSLRYKLGKVSVAKPKENRETIEDEKARIAN